MTTHYRFIAHLGQQLHLRQDVLGEGELLRGMMMKMMVIEGPNAQVRLGTPGGQRRAQARGAEPAANKVESPVRLKTGGAQWHPVDLSRTGR